MKKITLLLILFSTALGSYLLIKTYPKDTFTPEEVAQFEFQKKKERRKNGYHKMDQPDEFVKFYNAIRTKDGATQPEYSPNYKFAELSKAKNGMLKSTKSAKTLTIDWQQRGPANVPGRTRGLVVFEDDPNLQTWLAGSVGGGIWKTTDGGNNWVSKTDGQPNLSISYFGISKSNQNTVYAGSGEGFFNVDAIAGDGIFKSTDQGETWIQLPSTVGNAKFGTINRIVVDNTNSDILIAATQNITGNFIMKSIDGGVSWVEEYSASSRIQDLKANPDDFNILYASVNSTGIIKSIDAGENWANSSEGLQPEGRIEIAISPVNPNRIFLASEGTFSGNDSDLYITDDAGENWSVVLEENNGAETDFLGGQGWYDNTITAHPYDQDVVYYGGVNLWENTIVAGSENIQTTSITVDENNTSSFLSFRGFSAPYFGGALDIGSINESDFVSVEVRFGQGSQMAHRFTIPSGQGAGVAINDFSYQNYVEVPFQVWDIVNNKQLMISFRDQQDDGIFNLIELNTDGDATAHSREYIYVHKEDYSTTNSTAISTSGGQEVNQMYFTWPVLTTGGTWDKDNLPVSTLKINYETTTVAARFGKTTNLTDAYNEFSNINRSVHPDQHNLLMVKVDEVAETFKILNANDGGIYISNTSAEPGINNGDWTLKSNKYITGQFYGADKKKGADEYIGGLQDNGTWMSPPGETTSNATNYRFKIGGDGFEVLWNSNDTQKAIGGSQYNNFSRTVDGGSTWSNATSGIPNTGQQSGGSPFISKLENSNANPDVIFTVTDAGVYRSTNFGGQWNLTSITNNWGSGSRLNVEVSLANPNVVWAGAAINGLHVSADNGLTFSKTNTFTDVSLGSISGLETHPTEESTAYALFSFANSPKILKTIDMGVSWQDISGFGTNSSSSTGFPNVAIYSLLVMPHDTDIIWAGTEIGIFESQDSGATWSYADNGLPAVSVWQMKIVDDQVVVATHGRGIWSATIAELAVSQSTVADTRYIGNQKMEIDVNLTTNFDKLEVFVDDQLKLTVTANLTQGTHTYEVPKTKQEASEVYIVTHIGSDNFKSSVVNSIVADFAPQINSLISTNPGELLFDIQSAEAYTKIDLYLDDVNVGEITNPIIGQNEMIISGLDNKEFTGHVVGILNGTSYKSSTLNAQVIAGNFTSEDSKTFSIHPNPSSNQINIEVKDISRMSELNIYNVNGRLVSKINPSQNISVDISSFRDGIYFVNFRLDGRTYSEKIIVKH